MPFRRFWYNKTKNEIIIRYGHVKQLILIDKYFQKRHELMPLIMDKNVKIKSFWFTSLFEIILALCVDVLSVTSNLKIFQ